MIELFILMNVLISVTFIGNGVWLAPRLRIGEGRAQKVIRVSAAVVFILCALSYIEYALHAYELPFSISSTIHGVVMRGLQGVAGIVFLLAAKNFLGVKIVEDKKEREPLTLKDYEARWKLARDVLLFFFGAMGMAYTTTQNLRDPVIITAFSAMMGLPVILRGEERLKGASSNDTKPTKSDT